MELKVFSNKTGDEFRIGWIDEEFDMISDMSIKSGLFKLEKEDEITAIEQSFGANTVYHDYRKDIDVSQKDYLEHFKNYDSDKSYILPTSTFSSREQAEQCKDKLSQYI